MKIRLLGAAVLLALLVLFVPMFFPKSSPTTDGDKTLGLAIPPAPDSDMQTRTMNLNPDAADTPAGSATTPVIPDRSENNTRVTPSARADSTDGLATLDIASRKPQDVGTEPQSSEPAPPPKSTPNEPVIKQEPANSSAEKSDNSQAKDANGSFSLNLSAYSSDSGAHRLIKQVQALGYAASGRAITQRGKSLTLVTAGPFATRTAAESARLKISQSISGVPVTLESTASTPTGDAPATAPTRAPARSSKAEPAAAAAKAGGWAVQVAAMSSQSDANALRDKLRGSGFDGFVDSVNVGGKRLWRVRAGPQTQRDDALKLRSQIKSKLGMSGNVVHVP